MKHGFAIIFFPFLLQSCTSAYSTQPLPPNKVKMVLASSTQPLPPNKVKMVLASSTQPLPPSPLKALLKK